MKHWSDVTASKFRLENARDGFDGGEKKHELDREGRHEVIWNLNPIRKHVFGLDLATLEFQRFGFNTQGKAKTRLERVAMTVVEGYNAAVELSLGRPLQERANMVAGELDGFFS